MRERMPLDGRRWRARRRSWTRRLGGAALATSLGLAVASGVGGTAAAATTIPVSTCSASDLATAMANAPSQSQPVTIELKAGCTYTVTAAGYTGPNGSDAFTPVGNGSTENVTIHGNGATIAMSGVSARFFEVDTQGTLTLDGLTLTGGDAAKQTGGAVLNSGTLTVSSSTFDNDTATYSGGAVSNAGTLTVSSSTFDNDTATYSGGAIDTADGTVGTVTATVTDSTFTADKALGDGAFADGGAINTASSGGIGTLTVTGSTFTNNVAGGPIVLGLHGLPQSGGGGAGGAIDSGSSSSGTVTVTASTFSGNQAAGTNGVGGAINLGGGDGGTSTLVLTVSTFDGNSAAGAGGAIAEPISGSSATIVASTLAANTAAAGGGSIFTAQGATTEVAADVIASPAGTSACDGTPTDGGYDLVSDSTCGLTTSSSKVVAALASYLEPLANNTGPTQTMALVGGTDPVRAYIPNGTTNPTGPASYPSLCPRTDQTGFASPAGLACAVGAYEPRPASAPTAPLQPTLPSLLVRGPTLTMPYGGPVPTPFVPTYSGFVHGDTVASLSVPATCTTIATASSPVGTYLVPCAGAVDPNYSFLYLPGSLKVTPAPVTVTAPSAQVTYGSPLPTSLTPTYSGFFGGDTAASLTTPPTCTTSATAGSPVGAYPVTCSGAAAGNYTFTYVAGTLTITPAPLTVRAPSARIGYGQPVPRGSALRAYYAGFVGTDTVASLTRPATCRAVAGAGSAVGRHEITCAGASDPNYTITYLPGTLTVTPARLVVEAPSLRVAYGSPLPTSLVPSYAGFVRHDRPASLTTPPSCTTKARAGSAVGTYPVTCSGAVDPNYTIRYQAGTVTITPVRLVVTAPSRHVPFGTAPPANLPPSYAGFVHGDGPSSLGHPARCTTTANAKSHAGTYPVTCSGAVDPNYSITYVPGRLTVAPAPAPKPAPIPKSVPAGSAGLASSSGGRSLPTGPLVLIAIGLVAGAAVLLGRRRGRLARR